MLFALHFYSEDGTDKVLSQLKGLVNTPLFIPNPKLRKPIRLCHVDELVAVIASIAQSKNFESSFIYEIEGEKINCFYDVLKNIKTKETSKAKVVLNG